MNIVQRVIMVDDDPYSHMICKANIRHIAGEIEFREFILPKMAIEYVKSAYNEALGECPTVLLLDINMPVMNGWEFLEKYDTIDATIKNQITIFLLSSSLDPRDKRRAAENKYIKGFLMKPFRKTMVRGILGLSPEFIIT